MRLRRSKLFWVHWQKRKAKMRSTKRKAKCERIRGENGEDAMKTGNDLLSALGDGWCRDIL